MRTEIKNGDVILYGDHADFKIDTKRYFYVKRKNVNQFVKTEAQVPIGLERQEKIDVLIMLDRKAGEKLVDLEDNNKNKNEDSEKESEEE